MMSRFHVIAWGNAGRRDDGVALALTDRLITHFADDPTILIEKCHQLSPELSFELHEDTVLVFVDAHVRPEGMEVEFEPIAPAHATTLDTHHCGPRALLRLCEVLNGSAPKAYLLTIRAHDTEFGDDLSAQTYQAMLDAEQLLIDFLLDRRKVRDWRELSSVHEVQ